MVRTDIPLADQLVQVGHACLEAGHRFEQPEAAGQLVLLSVSSQEQLQAVVEQVELAGVRCVVFYEPDDRLGWTAACTEPISGHLRRVFRRLPLWRAPEANPNERGPPAAFRQVSIRTVARRTGNSESYRHLDDTDQLDGV